jgi:hypothetical protein
MRERMLFGLILILSGTSVAFAQPPDVPPPPRPVPVVANAPADAPPPPLGPPAPIEGGVEAPPAFLYKEPIPDAFATRFWVGADYLLWWTKDNHVPPLLTTGSPTDAVPGALGQPGTRVLIGDFDSDVRSGGRFMVGYWFSNDRILGLDASFFFLGKETVSQHDSSSGDPLLARPYFNVATNAEAADRIAFPGRRSGGLAASMADRFWGDEVNLRASLWRSPYAQVTLLGGYRYLSLTESLHISETDNVPAPHFPAAINEVFTADRFGTKNYFNGGQIGVQGSFVWGRLFADVTTKVALGATQEVAAIDGVSLIHTAVGRDLSFPFGELALPSNIGRWERSVFSVVPEVGVNFGYQVTHYLRASVGYTFLYVSRAVRPGDLVDTAVNPTQIFALLGRGPMVGPLRPVFPGNDSDFWAQGLNFNLEFRY